YEMQAWSIASQYPPITNSSPLLRRCFPLAPISASNSLILLCSIPRCSDKYFFVGMECGWGESLVQAHLYRSSRPAQPKLAWQITLAHPPSIRPAPCAPPASRPAASVRLAQRNYRDDPPAPD